MPSQVELTAMQRAVDLAASVLGVTNPNPAVGAVVLDPAGALVGEGATQSAGDAHAEIVALRAAGERAAGGTLVVTLEPCRHQGRTGPCTAALLAAGVSRVVYAVADPHGLAAGGADLLRSAGVDVEAGVLAAEAASDLEPWLVAVQRRRPHVTWKYAATLDGRTAAADGTSRWVTGADARRDVHRLRLLSDAVVVDGKARTPVSARILDDVAPTLVAVGADADTERVKALRGTAAEVVELPRRDGRLDLGALLATLFERDALRVLLEGGATLAGSFVRERLVDRVVGYHAPALLGAGPPVLGDAGVTTIAAAMRLRIDDVSRVGDDVRIVARLEREGR